MLHNLLIYSNRKGENTLVVDYSAKNPFPSGQLKSNQGRVYKKSKINIACDCLV